MQAQAKLCRILTNIIFDGVRTMDNHWSDKTSSILGGVVRVIPRCAVEVRDEAVSKCPSGRDGTL